MPLVSALAERPALGGLKHKLILDDMNRTKVITGTARRLRLMTLDQQKIPPNRLIRIKHAICHQA
jgi:hypothetical protein